MTHCRRVGVLLALLTSGVQGQRAPQGWAFTWTITTSVRGQPAPAAGLAVDVVVYGRTARITPRPGANALRPMLGDAGVMLVRDGDSVLTVINHARRDALVATLGDLAAVSGGAGALQLTVRDVAGTVRAVGAAPPLDELTARRVVLDQRYTMAVQVQQMQREVRVSEEATLDLSAALAQRGAGFQAFAEQFLRALGKPRAVLLALRATEARLPRGIPVRTRTVTLTVAGSDTLRTESLGVLSGLQQVSVDTTTLVVPAGYRITDAQRLLQMRRP